MKVKAFIQSKEEPSIWKLNVEGDDQVYVVHHNYVHTMPHIPVTGDEVLFEHTQKITYHNHPEYKFILNLRIASKPSLGN